MTAQSTKGVASERIGMAVWTSSAAQVVETTIRAESHGVRQIWLTQNPFSADMLTALAGALARTSTIRVGTAITQTYPRNPLLLAQQALALDDIGPGRLRLGIGPGGKEVNEDVYGIPMEAPLAHLREYVEVLRGLLWRGEAEHDGRFFHIHTRFGRTAQVPLITSALGTAAFRLAGELADGAISWMVPAPYLLATALPALRAGAASAGRPAPPLLAHVPIALSDDRAAVYAAARNDLTFFAGLPPYARMFAEVGFPISPDGSIPDELIETLFVWGDDATIARRLGELLATDLDELVVSSTPVVDQEAERVRLMGIIGQIG